MKLKTHKQRGQPHTFSSKREKRKGGEKKRLLATKRPSFIVTHHTTRKRIWWRFQRHNERVSLANMWILTRCPNGQMSPIH